MIVMFTMKDYNNNNKLQKLNNNIQLKLKPQIHIKLVLKMCKNVVV